MAITVTTNSASISTTEYFLFGNSTTASYQTTDAWVQASLDLSNCVAGDEFLIKIYEKIDTTNARVVWSSSVLGTQPAMTTPSLMLANGYEISVIRVSGSDRTIPWTIYTSSGNIVSANNSPTISTTEYYLFSDSTTPTYASTDRVLQTMIDFSNMAVGDAFRVRVYEKIDGTNVKAVYDTTLVGTQSHAWVNPARFVGNGYEISVTKTAGTDRTVPWSYRVAS